MGLLDEAIREHLELKRRRGANPEEVAQEERDALGPVRREPESPLPPEPEAVAPPEPEAPPEPVPEPPDEPPEASRPLVESVPEEPLTPSAGAQPTVEWDFDEDEEQPGPQAEPPPEEDVLEETPEFLQETPEHERLWFEQKPPRDFDFDG
jgi:hypothetical protein